MKLTNQEIFDNVCEHFAKQGKRSVSIDKRCLYENEDGLKCAIGALLSQDELELNIKNGFNDKSIDTIHEKDIELNIFNKEKNNLSLLRNLQAAHDTENDLENLIDNLRFIANRFKLNNSKIELITHWS